MKVWFAMGTKKKKQVITNTLDLPIDKMLYIYLPCPHCEHQKNLFQFKQSKHFHEKSRFAECETGSNKVKLG
jgi:ssDNA-binding Zn-finger/Zn-ribbon topoisomerase 1